MHCGIIYKKEYNCYKYLDIVTGEKLEVSKCIKEVDYDEYRCGDIHFINNKLPSYDSKYFLIKDLGRNKLMYIDSDGNLQIGLIKEEDLRHVSNKLREGWYTNPKCKYKVDGRQIEFSAYTESCKIMVSIIEMYNKGYKRKVCRKYNGKFIEPVKYNTLALPSSSSKHRVIHYIGDTLYNLTYNIQMDGYEVDTVANIADILLYEVYNSHRSMVPIARSVTDNIYYHMLDVEFLRTKHSMKDSIVKVPLQEIIKNIKEDKCIVQYKYNGCVRLPLYDKIELKDNLVTVESLDGVYEYNIDKLNKQFGVEIKKDMRSLTLGLLGKEIDDVVLTNDNVLVRLETPKLYMVIPIECQSISKDALKVTDNVKQISIPNSVINIDNGFIRNSSRHRYFQVEVDNNEQLEVINVFRALNIYDRLEVTIKNKVTNYKDIEYFMNNGTNCTILTKLNNNDIRKFLFMYSKKEFGSFKGLDKEEEFRSLLVKWRRCQLNRLYSLCDEEGEEFVKTYINYIDKRVKMCYNKYIKNKSR